MGSDIECEAASSCTGVRLGSHVDIERPSVAEIIDRYPIGSRYVGTVHTTDRVGVEKFIDVECHSSSSPESLVLVEITSNHDGVLVGRYLCDYVRPNDEELEASQAKLNILVNEAKVRGISSKAEITALIAELAY